MNSMESLQALFDYYALRARVMPALIFCLPSAAWLWVLTFSAGEAEAVPEVMFIIVIICVLMVLAEYVRERGKAVEGDLKKNWGGDWPTVVLMRHTGGLSPIIRTSYIEALQRRLPDLVFPSREEEALAPEASDAIYNKAIDWLRENTRGSQHAVILKENAAYGFRRNLYAIRPELLWLSSIWLLGGALWVVSSVPLFQEPIDYMRHLASVMGTAGSSYWFSMLITSLSLLFATFMVTPNWVKQSADEYARRLLAACNTLDSPKPPSATDV